MALEEYVNVLWAMSEFHVEGSRIPELADVSLDMLQRCRQDVGADLLSRFASAFAELRRRHDPQNP